MARNTHLYSSIMRKINADPWFLDLPPMVQWLWFRLLTGRHVTAVPGLWNTSEGALAADLRIGKRRLRTLLRELCEVPYGDGTRRLYLDSEHGVLWLPKNITQPCNQPDNEFVVRGWISHLEMVTDCDLKDIALGEFRAWIEAHPQRFPNGVPEDFPAPRRILGRDRLPRPSTETVYRDRLPRLSTETVSPEAEKTVDSYARAREADGSSASARASFDRELDPNRAGTESVSTENGSKLGLDGVNSDAEQFVSADEFSTNKPESPTSSGRHSETVSQTVEGGVSRQEQEQEQEQTLSKDLSGCRTENPASGGPRQNPVRSSELTPAERCERSFTHPHAQPATVALFEAWKSESGKINATLDHKRRELFDRLVYEGVTIEEVIHTVRGAKLDDWATKKCHLDPTAILGSAGQREKYMAIEFAASKEAESARRATQRRYFTEPEVPKERLATPEDAQRALEQFEASQGRGGARKLAKTSTRDSVPAESGTVPVAIIASLDAPAKSEGELLAEHERKREIARAKLSEFEDASGELPPALEA